MSEPGKNILDDSSLSVTLIVGQLRVLVLEEIQAAISQLNGPKGVPDNKEWLKAKEAAELYGLPKTWFEERGRAGDIARTKPGRYVLFKRRDVETYLESKKNNNGAG